MSPDPLNGLVSGLLGLPNTWLDSLIRAKVRSCAGRPNASASLRLLWKFLPNIGKYITQMLGTRAERHGGP